MILHNYDERPNGRDSLFLVRLERAITRLGAPLGFNGDPLAEVFPSARTVGDLSAAHRLLASLPVELRRFDHQLALQMCQAAVNGRSRPDDRRSQPKSPAEPTAAAKLARERRRRAIA